MASSTRIQSAARAASLHMGLSSLVAGAVAWLVFVVWYPAPFQELAGGRALFLILMVCQVVSGPLLTLVLYDPAKSRVKWRVDLALIVLTQLGALAYGLNQLAIARPVFAAFEGDRFRVVQALDVDVTRLHEAPAGLRSLGFRGPRPLGVRLARPGDADHLNSIQLSAQGLHPAFRPSRWMPFEALSPALQRELRPLSELRERNPQGHAEIDAALTELRLNSEQVGYLPLVHKEINDWVVLVERAQGQPRAYLHLDGWR
jgi:hypothetical protein